jgi:hypothetical protein
MKLTELCITQILICRLLSNRPRNSMVRVVISSVVLFNFEAISLANKIKILWRWYISTNIMFLDISIVLSLIKNRPVYFAKQHFGDRILSPSSGKTYSVGPNR